MEVLIEFDKYFDRQVVLSDRRRSYFGDMTWVRLPPTGKRTVITFKEEAEGISIASEVVKVEGEDPDTPGYLRGNRVTRRSDVGDIRSGVRPLVRLRGNPGTVKIP